MDQNIISKICAALFLSGESVSLAKLSELIQNQEAPTALLLDDILKINQDLKLFGLQIINSEDSLQMTTIDGVSDILKKMKLDEVSGDLTPAALQVMTIVTYLPGCNRSDISYIRGAQSAASVRNLLTRGLIFKKEEKYYPTTEALQHLGVTKIEELPEYIKLNSEFKEKLEESLKDEN